MAEATWMLFIAAPLVRVGLGIKPAFERGA